MKTKKLAFRHINSVRRAVDVNSTNCGEQQVRAALSSAATANRPTGGDKWAISDRDNARRRLYCNPIRQWQTDGNLIRRSGRRGVINYSGFCVERN